MKLSDLFEARNPQLTYTEKQVKGQVDRVILELDKKESEKFTKLGNRYKELTGELDVLLKKREELNADIKGKFDEYFDAEDDVLTRVIDTISVTLTLTKKSSSTKTTVNFEKVLNELILMVPELSDKVEELVKVHSTIKTTDTEAKLRDPVIKEGVVDWVKRMTRKVKDFVMSVTTWAKKYDRRLEALKLELAR